MCLQRTTTCSGCGKDTDGLMTCYNADETTIRLCPDCLTENGKYCLMCGSIEANDYCDTCLEEIEKSARWDELEDEHNDHDEYYDFEDDEEDDWADDSEDEFRNGSLDY